jgi:mannose-1-phosphate guanylyltransferase
VKAVLLAAGFGSRLLPLTRDVPKCLIEVRGEVLLGRWLRILREIGVEQVIVNTHHLADQVDEYIRPHLDDGWAVVRREEEILGTAATIWTNRDLLSASETLVIHADNYLDGDLGEFVEAHRSRPARCVMSMLTVPCSDPSDVGTVGLDRDGVVVEFREKDGSSPFREANAAVYLLDEDGVRCTEGLRDFSTEVLPRLVGRIYAHAFSGTVVDIGTPERLREVNSGGSPHSALS